MKNNYLIDAARPFQVDRLCFAIGESASGYQLQSSVDYDGKGDPDDFTWQDLTGNPTPANEQVWFVFNPCGVWYRLKGNTGNVYLCY